MSGEVQDTFDQAVTRPLPIKAESAMGRFWPDMVLPLDVFYSPLLRLRYRSALSCCINQINLACHRVVLNAPQEASNKLAVELERYSIDPPLGTIYVKDCEDRSTTEGSVQFYQDSKHVLCCAVVRLPESEEGPCLTLGVTLHEMGHLLGLQHDDDPGSIMFPIAKIRPQLLPNKDMDTLKRIYNNNL
jgi:hypothetical protein